MLDLVHILLQVDLLALQNTQRKYPFSMPMSVSHDLGMSLVQTEFLMAKWPMATVQLKLCQVQNAVPKIIAQLTAQTNIENLELLNFEALTPLLKQICMPALSMHELSIEKCAFTSCDARRSFTALMGYLRFAI